MTNNDPNVPKKLLNVPTGEVYQPVYQREMYQSAHRMYQNSLGMMPSVVNTDPNVSVPKRNWCIKCDDCTRLTENDQEWS